MKDLKYRLFPLYSLAFLRVAIAGAVSLAIPLYYARKSLPPEIIGFLVSARALSYLFSPILFKNLQEKIGKKKCLIISFVGFTFIQIGMQFSLEPLIMFILLILDGIILGLFWPVLISSVSAISNSDGMRENYYMKDKLMKNYGLSWNIGGVFSYLIGTFVLYVVADILLMFRITLIYVIAGLFLALFFKEPKSNFSEKLVVSGEKNLKFNSLREYIEFPLFIPLFLITIYTFSGGSIDLIYPLKSVFLKFALFTNYLFSFIRITCQTIIISRTMSLSIKTFKRVIPFLAIIVGSCLLVMGLNDNIVIFGIVFGIFGICISFFYSFAFKLTIFSNISRNTSKYSVYFETMNGINSWFGPVICGFIAVIDVNLAFFFLSAFVFGGFVLFILLRNRIKTN